MAPCVSLSTSAPLSHPQLPHTLRHHHSVWSPWKRRVGWICFSLSGKYTHDPLHTYIRIGFCCCCTFVKDTVPSTITGTIGKTNYRALKEHGERKLNVMFSGAHIKLSGVHTKVCGAHVKPEA